MGLSERTKSLWAKSCRDGSGQWLPLYIHMSDAAHTAKNLWYDWVPASTKNIINRAVPNALQLFMFLAAVHDLGKATPAFQLAKPYETELLRQVKERIRSAGLSCKDLLKPEAIPHARASYLIAVRAGLPRELAAIIGGHHGSPVTSSEIANAVGYESHIGSDAPSWCEVQQELIGYAAELSGADLDKLKAVSLPAPVQMILSSIIIMTDWIVSDKKYFLYIDGIQTKIPHMDQRAESAWEEMEFTACWETPDEDTLALSDLYVERFDITPRPVQTAAADAMFNAASPGIVVIEAPMGEGKTEAALAAAEILAAKTGQGGVFFALPTQATSDGIFLRILHWISSFDNDFPHSITLAHGKSRLNEDYQGLAQASSNVDEGKEDVIVHDWFKGRKKGILADFVVGTVDQILMGGLQQRHLALRHLGLANKVVIIDECHAYDAYMNSYLYRTLNWLGAYKVPVIILSATLPSRTRHKLVEAYMNIRSSRDLPPPAWTGNRAYPLITYSDGDEVKSIAVPRSDRHLTVKIARLKDDELTDRLDMLLQAGGCAGIIVNTVRRAQELARQLSKHFGEDMVKLLHARMIASERVERERELRELLGKTGEKRPYKLIVVGTQVMEQSLDVDFDLLITDICPMDLLIQRIGRLHRHERMRPDNLKTAMCFVIGMEESGFEKGAELIYGAYMLMNTQALLPETITLPDDISKLVQAAYAEEGLNIDSQAYRKAKLEHEEYIIGKERLASNFQIRAPSACKRSGILDLISIEVAKDSTGKRAEAKVRDTGDAIEVLVILRKNNGNFYTLPFLTDQSGVLIPREKPDDKLAGIIAGCSLKLPQEFTYPWKIDESIQAFEDNNRRLLPYEWQQSSWLKDELFLVLDEDFTAEILNYRLTYDEKYGLMTEKAGDESGS